MDLDTYRALGLDRSLVDDGLTSSFNGRSFFDDVTRSTSDPGDAPYAPCPEAFPAAGTPRGRVEHVPGWQSSACYPGTTRDIWVYASAGLDAATDAPALMVFNDGGTYVADDGAMRVPAVLDSLVHAGELPPTMAVFVQAGRPEGADGGMGDLATFRQRSVEYDTCDDRYVTFLATEVLPLAEERAGRPATTDPARRLICGISSGGICSFNAAWHAPDRFGLVLSHCGSFTAIRGGHHLPYLVRTTERKPIRVVLQTGAHDLDTVFGNWELANRELAAALSYAGYEHRLEVGSGGHTLAHGGAILADSLRWLFR
ncbi:MAG TPA: alpha/beta hydrolase-fold protein [Acidimicrobiia bacterium]|nr:alpha/beta hydrolase-fold protein [Acidimicrobiia bacterium]